MADLFRFWPLKDLDLSSGSSVRRGGVALADQLVASATNFLTGIIIGRSCSQEDFGLYMLGLSIVLLATNLQVSLISTPYMVYSPRLDKSSRDRYTGNTLFHQLGLSTVAVSILIVTGMVLSTGIGPEGLSKVVWALVFTLSFILLREFVRNVCFAHLNFTTAFVLDLCVAVIQISGLLYLSSQHMLSVFAAFLVVGIACCVAVSAWLLLVFKSLSFQLRGVIPDFKRNWEFGKWIFASGLLWEASVYLYPWILTYFHGTASTGVWAACYGTVAIVNPVMLGMSNFLGPKIAHAFAEGGASALRTFVLKSSGVFTLFICPFSIFLVLFGDRLVMLLYGEKYVGHGLVVSLLAINLLIGPVGFVYSRALFAMERAELDFATNFIPLVALAVIGIWLVQTLSTVGVALGLLIGGFAVVGAKFVVYSWLNRSEMRNPVP